MIIPRHLVIAILVCVLSILVWAYLERITIKEYWVSDTAAIQNADQVVNEAAAVYMSKADAAKMQAAMISFANDMTTKVKEPIQQALGALADEAAAREALGVRTTANDERIDASIENETRIRSDETSALFRDLAAETKSREHQYNRIVDSVNSVDDATGKDLMFMRAKIDGDVGALRAMADGRILQIENDQDARLERTKKDFYERVTAIQNKGTDTLLKVREDIIGDYQNMHNRVGSLEASTDLNLRAMNQNFQVMSGVLDAHIGAYAPWKSKTDSNLKDINSTLKLHNSSIGVLNTNMANAQSDMQILSNSNAVLNARLNEIGAKNRLDALSTTNLVTKSMTASNARFNESLTIGPADFGAVLAYTSNVGGSVANLVVNLPKAENGRMVIKNAVNGNDQFVFSQNGDLVANGALRTGGVMLGADGCFASTTATNAGKLCFPSNAAGTATLKQSNGLGGTLEVGSLRMTNGGYALTGDDSGNGIKVVDASGGLGGIKAARLAATNELITPKIGPGASGTLTMDGSVSVNNLSVNGSLTMPNGTLNAAGVSVDRLAVGSKLWIGDKSLDGSANDPYVLEKGVGHLKLTMNKPNGTGDCMTQPKSLQLWCGGSARTKLGSDGKIEARSVSVSDDVTVGRNLVVGVGGGGSVVGAGITRPAGDNEWLKINSANDGLLANPGVAVYNGFSIQSGAGLTVGRLDKAPNGAIVATGDMTLGGTMSVGGGSLAIRNSAGQSLTLGADGKIQSTGDLSLNPNGGTVKLGAGGSICLGNGDEACFNRGSMMAMMMNKVILFDGTNIPFGGRNIAIDTGANGWGLPNDWNDIATYVAIPANLEFTGWQGYNKSGASWTQKGPWAGELPSGLKLQLSSVSVRSLAPMIGLSATTPALNAVSIRDSFRAFGITPTDGIYWINCNGVAKQVYCLMDSKYDGGGWMLLMKMGQSTTFGFYSDHWTGVSTLNENSLNLDAVDAKFDAFNYVEISDVMAIFPSNGGLIPAGQPNVTGGCVPGCDWGWSWLVKDWWNRNGASKCTALTGFNTPRDANPAKAIGNLCGWHGSLFSFQNPAQRFVFGGHSHLSGNGTRNWGTVRWGFVFNENGVDDFHSNDVWSGIGHGGATNWSAGDYFGCCGARAPYSSGSGRLFAAFIFGR